MVEIRQATYRNGSLVLKKKLTPQMEGKIVSVLIFTAEATPGRKEQFLRFVDQHRFSLPENYHFDREELYER